MFRLVVARILLNRTAIAINAMKHSKRMEDNKIANFVFLILALSFTAYCIGCIIILINIIMKYI